MCSSDLAPDGQRVVTPPGSLSQALERLATQWPASIAGTELRATITGSNPPTGGADGTEDRRTEDGQAGDGLGQWWRDLFQCCCRNLVQVTASASPVPRQLPSHPHATQLARIQADEQELVVNLRHQPLRLSAEDRAVLRLADGTRTVEQLRRDACRPTQPSVQRLHSASLFR